LKPIQKTILWCCLLTLMLPAAQTRAEWFSEEAQLMGTRVSVELWGEDAPRSRQLIAEVLAEFQRLDLMMNPWNPASELARINREAGHSTVVTTPEILAVVERALYYSRLSEGAFDISFASVGQHYDYRQGRAPDDEVIARDRDNIDYRAIEIDPDAGSIRFAKAGLQVDLGGIAKGYAVDRGIDILRGAGIESAVISAGGDSRILGDLGDRPRTIGIRHPRRKNEYAVMIPLADTAISTSGDYERFFMQGEVRVHHILNPDTGRSAQGLQSASVLAPLAEDSDALSTTVFVLGVERGLQLVNSLPGVDAILIDGDGKLHYSEELLLSTRP
jgi:thiamine biosynthesis lipoprotein